MRKLGKITLALIAVVFCLAVVPAVKADAWVIDAQTGGFWLNDLGNTGFPNGLDSLVGGPASSSNVLDLPGSFTTTLNELMFTVGFTGENSHGSQEFSFLQPLTINGQTQMLELLGQIDIGLEFDTVHILSATPLTYDFGTFSVDVSVIPISIAGTNGVYGDLLKGEITLRQNCDPVPEPGTLTLLGLGLAGTAAKIRQRRKRARLNQSKLVLSAI